MNFTLCPLYKDVCYSSLKKKEKMKIKYKMPKNLIFLSLNFINMLNFLVHYSQASVSCFIHKIHLELRLESTMKGSITSSDRKQ